MYILTSVDLSDLAFGVARNMLNLLPGPSQCDRRGIQRRNFLQLGALGGLGLGWPQLLAAKEDAPRRLAKMSVAF